MNEGVIDAGTELEERESAEREASGALEGERGASDVGTHRRALVPGTKSFLFVMVGVIGILAALFTWKALKMKGEDGAATKTVPREQPRIQSVLPALNRNTPLPSAQRVQMASPGAATLASGDDQMQGTRRTRQLYRPLAEERQDGKGSLKQARRRSERGGWQRPLRRTPVTAGEGKERQRDQHRRTERVGQASSLRNSKPCG